MTKRQPGEVSLLLLLCLPAAFLAILIAIYGINVPTLDQFFPVGVSATLRRGVFDFRPLLWQRNDSRCFFPFLLLALVDFAGNGNLKFEMFATLLVAAVVVWNVVRLARYTVDPGWGRSLAVVLASALIFSPVQYDNWLWGIQLICFMPIACLTGAVVICYSQQSAVAKLVWSAVLAFVATFSYANGMICWVLLLGIVLMQFQTTVGRVKAAAAWGACMALALVLYFRGYHWIPNTAKLSDLPGFKDKVVACYLAMLGAPLGLGRGLVDRAWPIFLGALVLILIAVALGKLLGRADRVATWRKAAGWLTIAAYSVGSAAVTTIGRGRDTNVFLLESRYTTFSLYAVVGLIFLLLIAFGGQGRGWYGKAGLVLATLFVATHVRTTLYAVEHMKTLRAERLQGKACMGLSKVVDDVCKAMYLDWDKNEANSVMWAMDQAGYMHPPRVTDRDPDHLVSASLLESDDLKYGAFDSLTRVSNGFYRASGWAVLPDRGEPADAVVLTYNDANGNASIFAIAKRQVHGSDPAFDGFGADQRTGWEHWVDIPAGAQSVQAYAYDAVHGRFFPLAGKKKVPEAPDQPVRFLNGGNGAFEYITPGNPIRADGWARLLPQDKPADRILMTCGPGEPLVATGVSTIGRPDLVRFLNFRFMIAGWRLWIPRSHVPAQGCEAKAWAWSRETNEARLLPPGWQLPAVVAGQGPPLGSVDSPEPLAVDPQGFAMIGGWALSPSGISTVDIWREGNSGEGLILVGTVAAINGSRPDVRDLYPEYPNSASPGWNYRLSVRDLPGHLARYRIHAIAHDLAGKTVDLGTRTLVLRAP